MKAVSLDSNTLRGFLEHLGIYAHNQYVVKANFKLKVEDCEAHW